jgi:hypothetical protein
MPDDSDKKIEYHNGLAGILSSTPSSLRLIIVVIVCVITGLAALRWGWNFIEGKARTRAVSFTVTPEGATLVLKNDQPEWGMFLLSANIPWANTGIEVPPHGEIELTASGSVSLGVAHMVADAEAHTKPNFGWNTPDGIPWLNYRPRDALREMLLVMPNAPFGALIATLHSETTEPPPSSINPRPKKLFLIGSKNRIRNDSDHTAKLWLIVNDVLFPSTTPEDLERSKMAYVGNSNETEGFIPISRRLSGSSNLNYIIGGGFTNAFLYRSANWTNIVAGAYWHLYYDDNIGNFLIHVHHLSPGQQENKKKKPNKELTATDCDAVASEERNH